jgi:hypothetical protein
VDEESASGLTPRIPRFVIDFMTWLKFRSARAKLMSALKSERLDEFRHVSTSYELLSFN